ncbi:MAG: molybdopterin-binding protein, partial [Pirellulales bacterium]
MPELSYLRLSGKGCRMLAEIIAIGDELTSGQRLDTNSQWLSRELGLLGIPVGYHTTACDTLAAGVHAFGIAARRAQVVVATGGLGPTADDLTRDVLS